MTYVSEAMHPGVDQMPPGASLADLAHLMQEKDIGAVAVSEGDTLLGIVTDRDIALRGLHGEKPTESLTASDIMSQPVVFCHASDNLEDAVRLMESRQVRRIPVINGRSKMVGMLTLGDISHCGHRDLAMEVMSAVSSHHE